MHCLARLTTKTKTDKLANNVTLVILKTYERTLHGHSHTNKLITTLTTYKCHVTETFANKKQSLPW